MSILKEVDDDWILRRLERWGSRDLLPLVGPKKGAILQGLILEKNPKNVVEVGSFLGSARIVSSAPPFGAFGLLRGFELFASASAARRSGYSAILIARALSPGATLVTIESDLWVILGGAAFRV